MYPLLLLILAGAIAYFHYTQGLFSAGVSMILAILSALVAVGWAEAATLGIMGGKYADASLGIMMVILFGATYLVLRVIFDRFVPGNLRFPVVADRIGAGVLGFVTGLFTVGVIAIATQTMPFGPSLWGYERFPMKNDGVAVRVAGQNQMQDRKMDEVDGVRFVEDQQSGMFLPADSLLLGALKIVSRPGGSLETGIPFASLHPSYLQELFGQRLAVEPGAMHTAMPGQLSSVNLLRARPTEQSDYEEFNVRTAGNSSKFAPVKPVNFESDKLMPLVVRLRLAAEAADGANVRMAPSDIRLVVAGDDGSKNLFPVGIMNDSQHLFLMKPDDRIMVAATKTVDVVFAVDPGLISKPGAAKTVFVADAFIEVKRYARKALAGEKVTAFEPAGDNGGAFFKVPTAAPPMKTATPPNTPATPEPGKQPPAAEDKRPYRQVRPAGALANGGEIFPVGVPAAGDGNFVALSADGAGFGAIQNSAFRQLVIEQPKTQDELKAGAATINHISVGKDQKIIFVPLAPAGSDPWAWGVDLKNFKLTSGQGAAQLVGYSAVSGKGPGDKLVMRFTPDDPPKVAQPVTGLTPVDFALFFAVSASDNGPWELTYGK